MIKDSDAVLDYQMKWADWLDGDTITDSQWLIPDGLVKVSDSHDDTTATIWLSGGTAPTSYDITNRITTAAGRTDDRTKTITVRER